ncbi:aminotransferase class III-fold pyridoxal phosphate-dependent enzyme [Streptomyces sp. NPDC047108]|uniref:aminotransferase class III-fold pyridoxal phosphate-dependent enzyme n=1 Tax=Streptomyces sp. NPDC047108 TaxID=3155025 RepID=UPI0033FCA0E2
MRRESLPESTACTDACSLPIVPVRARGLTIEGADGRRYLDCLSGAGSLVLGHNHPVVLEAIRSVLDSGAPLHVMDLATPVEDDFTTELLRTLPRPLAERGRVRFCGPAGTDAVGAALDLVCSATGRSGLFAFSAAVGGTSPDRGDARGQAPAPRVTRLPYPSDDPCSPGNGDLPGTVDPSRARTPASWAGSAGAMDLLTSPQCGAQPPAGVIVEPVQGEGELMPVPDEWLRRMRHLTAARGIPFVVDEMQTGVGRTGTFWAVERSGVAPDVMVLSAAIGGSLPLAVMVYRDDLDPGHPGASAGAFRGNQLALAAGAATLAHVRENRLAERAATVGERMIRQLRAFAAQRPCVVDVRGRGLMIGVELAGPEGWACTVGDRNETGEYAPSLLAAAVQNECLRRGLIVGVGGRRSGVVRLLPPLTISDEQADAVLERLGDAIDAAARDIGRSTRGSVGTSPARTGTAETGTAGTSPAATDASAAGAGSADR